MKLRQFLFLFLIAILFFLSCVHVPPGQIKKETTPGHLKKHMDEHPGKKK
jgi:hypothetical protein